MTHDLFDKQIGRESNDDADGDSRERSSDDDPNDVRPLRTQCHANTEFALPLSATAKLTMLATPMSDRIRASPAKNEKRIEKRRCCVHID